MSVCRDKIRPEIIPDYEVVKNVEDSKDVAIVSVHFGNAVHALWNNNSSKYMMRVGTQNREASLDELRRLFQQRNTLKAEQMSLLGTTLADLDLRRLKHYFAGIREQEVPVDEDVSAWQTLLVNTEIMTEGGVTIGGMLLFGKTPKRFLSQAGIECAAFPEVDKDYDFQDRASLRGSLTPLKDGSGEIVENGIVEQALEFVKRNTRKSAKIVEGRREETDTYPEEIIREVVVNALIHRDYLLSNMDIELSAYSDRLEIISPGKLVNGITIDRIKVGIRSARNLLLKDVMRDYGYMEHMGLGISRKVVKGMKEHNGTSVEMDDQDERFIVRLFAKAQEN